MCIRRVSSSLSRSLGDQNRKLLKAFSTVSLLYWKTLETATSKTWSHLLLAPFLIFLLIFHLLRFLFILLGSAESADFWERKFDDKDQHFEHHVDNQCEKSHDVYWSSLPEVEVSARISNVGCTSMSNHVFSPKDSSFSGVLGTITIELGDASCCVSVSVMMNELGGWLAKMSMKLTCLCTELCATQFPSFQHSAWWCRPSRPTLRSQ